MTIDTPLTRYSATNGALASGFVTPELHHLMGHDRLSPRLSNQTTRAPIVVPINDVSCKRAPA